MVPFHEETGSLCGKVHDYTEGSIDKPLCVWLHALCWIGGLWMVYLIYELTSVIGIRILPSHQAGEEQGNLGGSTDILLRYMLEHIQAGN